MLSMSSGLSVACGDGGDQGTLAAALNYLSFSQGGVGYFSYLCLFSVLARDRPWRTPTPCTFR